jgi:DNA-binding HxlR family transcriptional regulator
LSELREAGVVELTDDGYRLTRHGDELMDLVGPMSAWAKRWARRMDACS